MVVIQTIEDSNLVQNSSHGDIWKMWEYQLRTWRWNCLSVHCENTREAFEDMEGGVGNSMMCHSGGTYLIDKVVSKGRKLNETTKEEEYYNNKSKNKAWGIPELRDLWDGLDRGWKGRAVTDWLGFGFLICIMDIPSTLTDRIIEFSNDYLCTWLFRFNKYQLLLERGHFLPISSFLPLHQPASPSPAFSQHQVQGFCTQSTLLQDLFMWM